MLSVILGDAVSVTSTVNLLFGSKFMSPSTGIVMNNQVWTGFLGVKLLFGTCHMRPLILDS